MHDYHKADHKGHYLREVLMPRLLLSDIAASGVVVIANIGQHLTWERVDPQVSKLNVR